MTIQYRRQLVDLLRHLNLPLIGAELGVAEGLFSRDLLEAGLEKLYCVDVWEHVPKVRGDANSSKLWHEINFREAKKRLKPFGDKAVILKGKTVDMAVNVPNGSLGLLYIDADHSYEGVTRDLNHWVCKVVTGGVVALHDYEAPEYGVKQAVLDYCNGRYEIKLLPEDKKEDAGAFFIKTILTT